MEVKLQEIDDRSKSNSRRIEALEEHIERQDELIKSVAVMAEKQNEMDKSLGEIKSDIKQIKDKPAKRWDSIVEKALLCVVTGLIGYIFVKLGLA
ncbi:MAG: hypothetical protein Q4D44_03190 [Eubacteriales bacterium]|nr:hypothetical protein [Eubacteriales bacterium]